MLALYDGGKIITGYDVSGYKFPVLVREGAIIPMYPESYYDDQRQQQKPRDPLTLDIYPSATQKTKFELLEDDGLTYRFKTEAAYNKTLIECDPIFHPDAVIIKITGLYEGMGYTGMPEKRNYHLQVHGTEPETITIKTNMLTKMKDVKELKRNEDGWYFDPGKGLTHIKVKSQKAQSSFSVVISKRI